MTGSWIVDGSGNVRPGRTENALPRNSPQTSAQPDLSPTVLRDYIEGLAAKVGGVRPPVKLAVFRALHKAADYSGMVRAIQGAFHLKCRLRVGLVNSGGPTTAPAWVSVPSQMPPIGTAEFLRTNFTLYMRKNFLLENSTSAVCAAISHELSHIILDSIGHRLRTEEKAVDLTAMILGFRGSYSDMHGDRGRSLFGYLSPREVLMAKEIIDRMDRKRGSGLAALALRFGFGRAAPTNPRPPEN